jgi:hypothetical protein
MKIEIEGQEYFIIPKSQERIVGYTKEALWKEYVYEAVNTPFFEGSLQGYEHVDLKPDYFMSLVKLPPIEFFTDEQYEKWAADLHSFEDDVNNSDEREEEKSYMWSDFYLGNYKDLKYLIILPKP